MHRAVARERVQTANAEAKEKAAQIAEYLGVSKEAEEILEIESMPRFHIDQSAREVYRAESVNNFLGMVLDKIVPSDRRKREQAKTEQPSEPDEPEGTEFESLLRANGMTSVNTAALTSSGFESVESLESASDDQLLAVQSIGPATLSLIRTFAPYKEAESTEGSEPEDAPDKE